MAALIQPSGRRSRTRQSSTIPSNVTEEPTSFVEEQPDTPTHQGEAPVHAPGGKTARVHFEANGEDHHEGGTYQPQAKLPIGKKQTTMKAAVSVAPTSQDTILKDFKNSSKLQGYAPVWDRYVKMAEEEDEDLVEDWDRIIDVTLVFAALFSAVLTGFVLESAKGLQVDQSQATVSAIKDLTGAIQATLNTPPGTQPGTFQTSDDFHPTTRSVWVNCIWFLSLGLSISVSLFAMLAKRWCYNFRSRRFGTAFERSMKRQKSWDEIEQWKMELIMEQLPTLMHVALMLFFIGLVIYLSEIHTTTTIVMSILVGATLTAYWVLTLVTVWSEDCPLATPFTRITLALKGYVSIKPFRRMGSSVKKHTAQTWSKIILWTTPGLADTWQSILIPEKNFSFRRLAYRWRRTNFRDLLFSTQASLKAWVERFIKTITAYFYRLVSRFQRKKSAQDAEDSSSDWIMKGSKSTAGSVIRHEAAENNPNPHAFGALVWILRHSNDKETITEVLEHVANFPEVILESSISSRMLYTATLQVTQCLTRFQHDAAGWRDTDQLSLLCGQLAYMAARPWLHPPLARESVYQEKLVEFCVLHFPKMSTDDFNGQIRLIEQAPFHNSKRLIVWLETLAGKIVLGCPPEQSLQICMSLCKKVLSSQSLQVHDKQMAETRLALWWIFLNCTFDCSHSSWPGNNYYDSHSGTIVETDSLLTLTHLRDSRKRETQSCWLAITGVSGILYAFTASPDHHSGPHHEANHKHFGEIIKILYAAICTPALSDENDQFMGTLPVYRGTEVRLYEFDSLDFCLDALTTATGSSCYDAFSSPLNNLVSQVQVLKDIKQAQASFERDPSNLTRIILQYQNSLYTDRHPELWMAAGLFHRLPTLIDHICSISGGLRFVSRLIADLFFGFPPNVAVSVTLPDSSDELSTKMAACLPWMLVLWWAWAPFGELLESGWTTQEVATKSPPRSRFLWKIIRDIGLLHMECSPDPYVRLENYTLLSIKAGLLEKLYSFPPNGSDSPDQLEWSLALSKQVYRLLQFWWAGPEEHSVDDQAFIITSLSKLLEFLVNANCQTRLDSDRNLAIQPTNVIANGVRDTSNAATSAYTQLDLLVAAGALQKLGLPFSQEFRATRLSSSDIPDENKWRNRLVEIIDKVARVDPQLAAFRGRIPYPDIIEFYTGLPEGHDRRTEMLNIVTALSSYMTEIREASGRQDSVEPS